MSLIDRETHVKSNAIKLTLEILSKQILGIERTISWKHNYKTKLTKISLMIEESCFRANSGNNGGKPANNQNSQNNKPNSHANQNNPNNGNQTKTVNSQKMANSQKIVKAGKTADKKTTSNNAPASTNKKVESRD